ncbi:hypothetical protein IFM89_032767 [Coptis chinensis]|uniref:Uncharacterized protein n=1 Tax=Coptis chinensis TaxID=261450 RepID=A0A835LKG3_9MAGN|nr:hypothetical protein IFM89_032767 [Coptis chinensis]
MTRKLLDPNTTHFPTIYTTKGKAREEGSGINLELMQSGTKISSDAYPSFVCNRIHKLMEIKTFVDFDPIRKRNFPSVEKQNFLISHVLVLALIADGYRTDMSDIARDLKMEVISVRKHYLNLGCKLKLEGKVLYATLPVPLEFPKPSTRKRKRY